MNKISMTQETFNEKDSSQISGENENIKILTKRTFESGIGYRLKHIHSLMSMNNPDSLPKYWDDPSISIDESSNIEWMAGVEIHLYKNVIAFYGRNLTDHRKKYLGPILFMENSPEGQIKFKSDLCNLGFKITRFLMETTGIYHFSVAWFLQKNYPNSMVIVMNAKSLKDYMPKISKNDKADAIRIAQVAHLDELIKPSYIPTELEFALRETLRQRNKLIATCVRQKNVIKKMFSTIGFTYKFNFDTNWEIELLQSFLSSTGNFGSVIKAVKNNQMVKKNMKKLSEWSNFSISDTNRGNILLMFSILKQSQLQVEMLETALVREIKKDTALCNKVDLLENCSGIGYISAVSLVLESGNMNRFHSVSHYLSYCGISPTSGTSGYDNPKDEVEKVVKNPTPNQFSNHHLKSILVSATGSILKKAREDPNASMNADDMVRYSSRFIIENQKWMKVKFKVAAKLARKIYYCLKNDIKYDSHEEVARLASKTAVSGVTPCQGLPKKVRQAWAYKQLELLKKDSAILVNQIDIPGVDEISLQNVRELFKQSLLKYFSYNEVEG